MLAEKRYIFGQGLPDVADIRYGKYPVSYNGCELVAVYNALVNLDAQKDFREIIKDAERIKGVCWSFFGMKAIFGTKPKGIGKLLKHYGRKIASARRRSRFNGMLAPDGTYIVTFFNRHIWEGIHTVMFVCDRDRSISVFNYCNNAVKAGLYESLDSYLSLQGKPIVLYKVE